MTGFIFLLIIIFVVIPVFRLGWRIFTMRRQYERAVHQQQEAFKEARRAHRPAGWSAPEEPQRKVVRKGEGEYVEWEEVSVTSETGTSTESGADKSRRRQRVSSYITQQISDVDYEDISD